MHVLQSRNAAQQEGGGNAAAVCQGSQCHCVWREVVLESLSVPEINREKASDHLETKFKRKKKD